MEVLILSLTWFLSTISLFLLKILTYYHVVHQTWELQRVSEREGEREREREREREMASCSFLLWV
jgi:hypothetical protein